MSSKAAVKVVAPGRINLIGEHTDYNDGFVLPAAIEQRVVLQLRKNGSPNRCSFYSENLKAAFEADLCQIRRQRGWENFILGVLSELLQRDAVLSGFDCRLTSNLPTGAGLSSSAALECGLACGLNELFDLGLDAKSLALLSQAAEHSFVGTQCGIMDQFASIMGRKDHFILLDCRNLDCEYIPSDLEEYGLLLLNSGVTHSLAESGYNQRRSECAQGVQFLQARFPEIRSLRDATREQLEAVRPEMPAMIHARCLYILEENARVLNAAKALQAGDIPALGRLMYESHEGMRTQYAISCQELDFLVDASRESYAVAGARMTGGGFGGCSLNLVRKDAMDAFIADMTARYRRAFNRSLEAIRVAPSDGVRVTALAGAG